MAIIGVSGKMQSGKNTVAKIINDLTNNQFKERAFAGKLKECIAIILDIPVEDLEKEEVKNRVLGEEWIRYGFANGFYRDMEGTPIMINEPCSKERYEQELRTNWQTAYKHEYKIREILQLFGTEVGRSIHSNFWINALFADYKLVSIQGAIIDMKHNAIEEVTKPIVTEIPNWIITDTRFPNEADAIKARGGIVIRVNRDMICPKCGEIENIHTNYDFAEKHKPVINYLCNECGTIFEPSKHSSETSLDNYAFDYVVDNNDTIEELIVKVKNILIKEKIL